MPRIKRWFPVSHDINHSGTMRDLMREFGLPGLRVWLEVLSIADRAGEWVDCTSKGAISRLTSAAETKNNRTIVVIEFLHIRGCLVEHDDKNHRSRIAKYWEYHRTEERNPLPPDLPDLPDLQKNKTLVDGLVDAPALLDLKIEENPDAFHVQDLVDSWNDVFGDLLPKVEWPLSPSRHRKAALRVKEHQSLDFWQKVFDQISSSDFLKGKGNGSWKCTFDFLINNDANAIKIYEGAYANGKETIRPGFNRWQGRR